MQACVKKILKYVYYHFKKIMFFRTQKNSFEATKSVVKRAKKLGFTSDEYIIFDLDNNCPGDYISEFERLCYREEMRYSRVLLDNKIVFYNIIKNFADVNKMYAYKMKGKYVVLENEFEGNNILKLLDKLGKIVFKKIDNGGGSGFKLFEYVNGEYFINRIKREVEEITTILNKEDNYIIEEFCEQSDFENELYPYSVNTLRIITAENENGSYDVLAAFQRMGVDINNCVDNACAGGIYSEIDIQTGELSCARSHAFDRFKTDVGHIINYSVHPITKAQIEGVKIPLWNNILNDVKEYHNMLRFMNIPFIAWDIALVNNGFRVIEANVSCSVDLLQTFRGHRNSAVGIWMRKRGYIK